ncbi:MAG: two-component sensor histidine kinase [Chitinophagaceae bacterium]|nr:two-component sensor histidine kinase [Chitinophagaceae bacterium]HMN32391.1 ATP-binding protein [Chitinophagaceae bacterium]
MNLSFRQRLFLYFAILFLAFTIGIALFEQSRETQYKTDALQEKLEVYADLIHFTLNENEIVSIQKLNEYESVFPTELRISIISLDGTVIYDNTLQDIMKLSNHLNRPEIKEAITKVKGTNIRKSTSNQHPYLYFAKKYPNQFIRVALPYNIPLQDFLKADNYFLYFLLILFLTSLLFIHKITAQFANSIKELHRFALKPTLAKLKFNNDELGEIGRKILENFNQLEKHKKGLQLEKQKLLQHIQISEEGICFMSKNNQVEFQNGLFIQYLNQLADEPQSNANAILKDSIFAELHKFLKNKNDKYFETNIYQQGKIFSLRTNLFEDDSFEIILTNITQQEKTKQLKHEMTGNIAHELRTPITSIRAYLETLTNQLLPEDKKQHFLQQAYRQTLTLSEIIKDMSIISKIEEAPHTFEMEQVNIEQILIQIKEEQENILSQKNIDMNWQIPQNLSIQGNTNLLYALFRNLTENAIRYAGENIKINISIFNEDQDFFYFSFSDTGIGISNEQQLNRIFERFYRVHDGRTRDTGGSGLGLSIVKNAVLFHKGNVTAKNRKGGGLEFIFMLKKNKKG